jgi:hypothetical protein
MCKALGSTLSLTKIRVSFLMIFFCLLTTEKERGRERERGFYSMQEVRRKYCNVTDRGLI